MTNDSTAAVTAAPYLAHNEWREMAYMAEGELTLAGRDAREGA
jgi:hypothetical protein